MFAKLLEDILTSDGYRATSAANGVEALALLANEAFDLVMIDIRMPELDGPSFYRELERRNPDQARPVMFMTGGSAGAAPPARSASARPRRLRAAWVTRLCARAWWGRSGPAQNGTTTAPRQPRSTPLMRDTTRATTPTASVATPISARRRRPFGPMFAARTAISVSALSLGPRDRSDRRWPENGARWLPSGA